MYTDRHQMFQTMHQLATSAQESPVTVKCENANQAVYVQRVFYEFKRNAKSGEVYDLFHSIRTKRKGMTVWFLPKTYSLDPVKDALGISTIADKAQDVVSKALSAHTTNGTWKPHELASEVASRTAEVIDARGEIQLPFESNKDQDVYLLIYIFLAI